MHWCLIFACVFVCFTDALKETLGLRLVGPFDILSKKHKSSSASHPNFHRHWRYFYDPPEFQTIIQGNIDTQHHMGYFRWLFTCCKKVSRVIALAVLGTSNCNTAFFFCIVAKIILCLSVSFSLYVSLYRDLPDALPVFIGENEAKKGCTITQIGDNIFAAVLWVSSVNNMSIN